MSKYRHSWIYATNFEGDNVTMKLTGMKRKHMQQLSKYIAPDEDGDIKLSFMNELESFEVFASILPECVSDFKGLVDFDRKQDIPFETVLEDLYFINLVSEIIQQVMNSSIMTGSEVKDLKKQRGEQQRVLTTALHVNG